MKKEIRNEFEKIGYIQRLFIRAILNISDTLELVQKNESELLKMLKGFYRNIDIIENRLDKIEQKLQKDTYIDKEKSFINFLNNRKN